MTALAAETLEAAEARRCRALIEGDAMALEAMLDLRFRYVHGSGRLEDRQSYVEGAAERRTRFTSFRHRDLDTIDLGGPQLLVGIIEISFDSAAGPQERRYRFASAWSHAEGRWQLVSWQNTALVT